MNPHRLLKFRIWFNGQFNYVNFTPGDDYDLVVKTRNPSSAIWQQYTGIKDKDGKEIYEGDIVKTGWQTNPADMDLICRVVYWMNGFYLEYNNHFIGDTIYQFEACEIIGNILENPNMEH